ncbi:MAG: phospholipase D family protein [Cardiobacteriaceae bacterium]|nr:phospholipase D family protein [Cardiobacteriaceae bacterium]
MLKKLALFMVFLVIVLVITAFISRRELPANHNRTVSQWLPPNPDGVLARAILSANAAHPGLSGVHAFADGMEAFIARLALAETAQYSLDVQYYIWHNDTSGHLLLQALQRAAGRGVRVRLLLDDNNTQGMDGVLLALDAHENAEVRLFNPFMQRGFRPIGYLSDFFRLNRRMHNKSFTADGLVSIVGGRNVGDEYFGAGDGVMFADLDVSVTGSVVPAIEDDFDRYWASESSYPITTILPDGLPTPFADTPRDDAQTREYLGKLAASDYVERLRDGGLRPVWAPATLFSDDPAKGLGKARYQDTVVAKLAPFFASAKSDIIIVSPYFVPTKNGAAIFAQAAAKGIETTVLTNSLVATDVAPVHAGYAKYRKDLLKAGVKLYELKPEASFAVHEESDTGLHFAGSSGASLHAKTFAVDGEKLFVGSFNMDPRSAAINTEMGIVFEHPALAGALKDGIGEHMASHAYHVTLTADGELQWRDGDETYGKEPQSSAFKRFSVWFLSWLPIEHLL